MFGRDKTSGTTEAGSSITSARSKEGGKGRPTPTRREAEARNRRPIVGAPPPPKGATRAERKVARAERNKVVRAERARQRQALVNGDERSLPAKDKGPVRRWVRDSVDARWNLGEFFLPIAALSLIVGILNIPIARLVSLVVLYAAVIGIAIDCFLLRRRIQRATNEKFGSDKSAGAGTYALLRALQFRRARLPKPVVGRGEFPRT